MDEVEFYFVLVVEPKQDVSTSFASVGAELGLDEDPLAVGGHGVGLFDPGVLGRGLAAPFGVKEAGLVGHKGVALGDGAVEICLDPDFGTHGWKFPVFAELSEMCVCLGVYHCKTRLGIIEDISFLHSCPVRRAFCLILKREWSS